MIAEKAVAQAPEWSYHIAQSEEGFDHIGTFLSLNAGDLAVKVCKATMVLVNSVDVRII